MYRKATFSDCARIYDLICDMERRELPFDRFRKIYRDQLINRHFYCLVNDQDGRVIAVLNMRFEEQLHHAEFIAEIMEFAVAPSFRNRGIPLRLAMRLARVDLPVASSPVMMISFFISFSS